MFLKKGCIIVAALALAFAGNAYAGSNATAVSSLDFVGTGSVTPNGTDDGVVAGTAAGSGTVITAEVFAKNLSAGLVGVQATFALDPTVVKVTKVTAAGSFVALPNTDTTAVVGSLSGAITPANGLLMTIEFTTQTDVTGKEFTIGIKSLELAASTTDKDTLSAGSIAFNSKPKVTADQTTVVIPRGGQATVTVTASSFAAGATVTFAETHTGSATIAKSDNGSGVLTLTGSGSGAADVTVTATDGTTTTDAVTIHFDEQVPVELASFGGELVDKQVVLNWTTASQTNNAGFRVLRSTDQETYVPVSDVIAGAGTTDALMNYSFNDDNLPAASQVFYVLEQIDLDGTIHRSNPVEVILGARFVLPTEFATSVYPNPFNPSTTISYDLPAASQVSIVIYDALGQQVRQLVNTSKDAGRFSVQWDAKDQFGRSVGSGVYIAKIKAGQYSATQKMLLLK